MKRNMCAVLTAVAMLGLTACGGGETPTSSSIANPVTRPVPEVVGQPFFSARNALANDGFTAVLVGKDGTRWTNVVPNDTVTVESVDPAPGTLTDSREVTLTLSVSQDSFLAASKAGAGAKNGATPSASAATDPESIATRYDFNCYNSDQTHEKFKSYKDVWASPSYAASGSCQVTVAGKDPSSTTKKHQLIPSEQALVEVVKSHKGDSYDPVKTVERVLALCAKLGPDYAHPESMFDHAKANAAAALSVCPDAPHAAQLEAELSAVKIGDGNLVVGKSMQPGTYKTKPGIKDCYWSRNTPGGDIIANDFVGFAPDGVTVTVYDGEGFESSRCGTWNKIG